MEEDKEFIQEDIGVWKRVYLTKEEILKLMDENKSS